MSIPDELKESKGRALLGRVWRYLPHFYIPLVLIFVGITSFSLGRLSLSRESSDKVQIVGPYLQNGSYVAKVADSFIPIAIETTTTASIEGEGEVVASKNGTVYYLPWCSAVSRIKPENLVRFASSEAAVRQGYKPSTACKGTK